MLQEIPLYGLYKPSCYKYWLLWAYLCVGSTLRLVDWEDWPNKSVQAAVRVLTTQNGMMPAEISLWMCCLWKLLDPSLMLSETHHGACWFLVLLRRTPVEINARYSLWLALSSLLELQSYPQLVVASAESGYAWEGLSCAPRLTSSSTKLEGRSAYGPKHS